MQIQHSIKQLIRAGANSYIHKSTITKRASFLKIMIRIIFFILFHGFKSLGTDTLKLGKSDCSIKKLIWHTNNAYKFVCFNPKFTIFWQRNKIMYLFSLKGTDDVKNKHDNSSSIFGMEMSISFVTSFCLPCTLRILSTSNNFYLSKYEKMLWKKNLINNSLTLKGDLGLVRWRYCFIGRKS